MHYTATIRANPPPQEALSTFPWTSKMCLPQTCCLPCLDRRRVLRHTVEQMADSTPVVPMLEAPVQQLGCARASCGASPRPGSAGGDQAPHSDASDGLIRGPRESLFSHVGRDALHRVADASVQGG